jgi:hypothetical protein
MRVVLDPMVSVKDRLAVNRAVAYNRQRPQSINGRICIVAPAFTTHALELTHPGEGNEVENTHVLILNIRDVENHLIARPLVTKCNLRQSSRVLFPREQRHSLKRKSGRYSGATCETDGRESTVVDGVDDMACSAAL